MDESTLHPNLENGAARTQFELQLLIETGHLLAGETSLRGVVQTVLHAGSRLCDAPVGGFFAEKAMGASPMTEGVLEPVRMSWGGVDPGLAESLRSPVEVFDSVPRLDVPVLSDDLSQDPRVFSAGPAGEAVPEQGRIRSYLAVPMRRPDVGNFGFLVFGHPEAGRFRTINNAFMAALAAQATLAMQNAQLRKEMRLEVGAAHAGQQQASRRLRQALEAAQLGTWNWDAASGLVDFDERAADLLGVPPGIGLPRNALRDRLLNPEDLHRSPADLRSVLAGSGGYAAEYRVAGPDDIERWIAATGNSVHDANGRPVGMIGTLQDITPRKRQEHSLRTSEKLAATGRLAATIAHEINNPLEAVTNLIYLAKTDPITPPSVSRMLETADTELARVSQIAQQTMGFYRDTTRPVSVDLNDLLKAVVNLFDRKLSGKRLHCTLDLEPGLSVLGLQGEIRQMVSNLLVNAIDASASDGGHIRIRGRHRRRDGSHGVSVMVSDQGSGIPHHVRPRLFTPFTTTKKSTGTGLGLWVTQGMVEKHGGSVRFRSRVVDPSGTVFRVYLPVSGSPQLFAHQSSPILQ